MTSPTTPDSQPIGSQQGATDTTADRIAVPADVAFAADKLWQRLADLQGEHEVMVGPFDPSEWTIDGVEASHVKAIVEFLCPGAKEALNKHLPARADLHAATHPSVGEKAAHLYEPQEPIS